MRSARDWDQTRFPAADHELTSDQIMSTYGDLIQEFVLDVATSPDLDTLTRMATVADGIVQRRAR